ncbi:SusC/RagA family TonB-linked outer membrane protein [Butyricimonas paravirosa]
MRKRQFVFPRYRGVLRSILKYCLFCSFLLVLIPSAGYAQGKINIEMKHGTLKEVFAVIQEQGNLRFLYSEEDVAAVQVKDVNFKDVDLKVILDHVLKNTGLTWRIRDEVVSIMKDAPKGPQLKGVKVEGKITDVEGNTLPGVSIVIKGSGMGTTSDVDGKYALEIPDKKGTILVFSFIGMKSREISYDENRVINVKLEEDVKDIDEVIVTGYFNKNKSSFTGTASTYSAEDLKKVNPVNLLAALSVLDPSFRMVENNLDGSNPNVIPEFQVRGGSSMPGTNELKSTFVGSQNMPTFILDGFEVTASKVFDLDPERIESMTILKDAAATAIYGSRASNGVVVINTKQPALGKIRVLYNMDLSFNIPDLTDYDLLNAREKLELEKASGYFDALGSPEQTEMRERDYNYRLGLVESGYNTYWLDKPLRTAVGHKHSLSVEGGENAMRYSLDLRYENSPGVMKESGRVRVGMGVMLQYRFKNVNFRNSVMYDNVRSVNSPYGSFRTYARLNPYYKYVDEDGNYLKNLEDDSALVRFALGRAAAYNPLYNTTLHTVDEASYSEFVNNFGIDWNITESLRLKGNFAIRHKKNEGTVFKPSDHTDFASYTESDFYRKGYYSATEGKEFFYDGNVVISYFKQLDEHFFNANVVWNIQGGSGDVYTVRAEGFPDDRLDYISFAAQYAKSVLPTGDDYVSRLMGVVGNIGYTYRNCYLLDASIRFDGSSKFGSESRWAPFWSVGLGWNLHSEKFMSSLGWLSILKPKVSYGVTGSQSYDPYQSMITYEYYTQERYRNHVGAQMMGLGNPNLKWQQTDQFNVGFDFGVLNERIFVSANYYRNVSKNLLTDVSLPSSLGFDTYRENLGKIENKGYELNLRAVLIKKKDIYLNITASGVHNVNILKKISNSLEAWNKKQDESTENLNVPKVRYVEGQSINSIWGVPSLGINPASGKEIFVASNGTLVDEWNPLDQRVIGCTDPDLEGNLGLNAGYKGLQLSCYFMYRLGGQLYNSTLVERIENVDKKYNTDRRVLAARWQKAGDVTFFKDVKDESYTRATSRFIEDYNYLQFSSLNLSYDFPESITRKLCMENLRLSFSMNDVFRLSSVKIERGLDYPFARAFRASLRVIF